MPTHPFTADRQSAHIVERLRASLAGRYALEGEIGRGGMATVYGARDLRHDRQVAVKVLPPELATAIAAERFLFEIRAAAQLLHPHILGLIDSGDADGVLYYIMPHVRGETLRDKLDREKRLSMDDAARITREVASALTHAHEHGLVHRDIKPENILLVDGRHAMVADFGLARAILRSADRKLTLSKHLIGTLPYMSPEQAASEEGVDGRSDIYSLGCMLFELLAGHPPFQALSDLAIITKHLREPPPRLSGGKTGVPLAVERVVHRALEKEPARRFQIASDLSRELDAAIAAAPRPWYARRLFPSSMRLKTRAGVSVIALAAVAGVALATPPASPIRDRIGALWSTPLDNAQFVVFPFWRSADAPRDVAAELMLHDALQRWRGVGVVEQSLVSNAISLPDTLTLRARNAPRLSRSFGAGRYVLGDVTTVGDSVRLHASVFDAATAVRLHEVTIKIGRTSIARDEPYRQIANALLFHLALAEAALDPGTTSYVARQAFLRGERALGQWDLATADSAFSDAITDDANYAAPYLWLAQVKGWTTENPQQWRSFAQVAVKRGGQLVERERKLGSALLAMADGDYPGACALYQQLRASDPRDFAAAYGAGECVRRDSLVVPDTRSPSGWSFRGSRFRGINAYRDAFELLPSIHKELRGRAFERLRSILMTTTTARLEGKGLPPDTTRFRAAPSWAGDSLALVPFPMHREIVERERIVNATTVLAVNHQRAMFRDIAISWRRAFPDDVETRVAMAVALELLGDSTALDTVRVARRLAVDDDQRIRLAAQEVWLGVKFGVPDNIASLAAARDLADSLLLRPTATQPSTLELLAGLAVLTGRANLAAELTRRATQPRPNLPIRLASASRALLVYSALGGPLDSIVALERHISVELRGAVVASQYSVDLYALLGQPAALSYPVQHFENTAALAGHSNPVLDAQAALAKGDSLGARAILDALKRVRAMRRPADLTLDITYPAAWTLAALGDPREAVEWLEPVLNAAQDYPPQVISTLANSGALIRGLMLRAELADGAGDAAAARRWRKPVSVLWQNADSSFRPFIQGKASLTFRASPNRARTH